MARKWTTAAPGVRYREDDEHKQKNGRSDRYFAVRYSVDGKQREEGLGWASEGWNVDKAQTILARLKEAARTGAGPRSLAALREANLQQQVQECSAADELTVAMFFDEFYLPDAAKRKSSWTHDRGRFDKGIRPRLGDMPFRALTRGHLETLMDGLRAEGLAEATVLQYMAVMRQMLSLAKATLVEDKPFWVESFSPLQGVELPGPSEERERFLEYAEADRLLDAAETLPVDTAYLDARADMADLIRLALNTGLRFGELMRLEWRDISLVHGFLTVRADRQRKPGGRVPLNRAVLEVLRNRNNRRSRSELHVFPEERAGKDGCVLRRLYAEAVEACGLNQDSTSARDKVVFHTLRHTFASWLALAGTDIYRIKTLMRHKTLAMTMRYAHLLPDATRDAVERLRPEAPVAPVAPVASVDSDAASQGGD